MESPIPESCPIAGKFSFLIRGIVAIAAFSILIVKWKIEKNRRTSLVWTLDVSKQIVGASIMHLCNLLASLSSGSKSEVDSNPCVWYSLNLFLDCTVGVFIVFGVLKIFQKYGHYVGIKFRISDSYGDPPSIFRWAKQCLIFTLSLLAMKAMVVISINKLHVLFYLGKLILLPATNTKSPNFEVFYVLAILPLILNAFEFVVIDQMIKTNSKSGFDTGRNHSSRNYLFSFQNDYLPLNNSSSRSSIFSIQSNNEHITSNNRIYFQDNSSFTSFEHEQSNFFETENISFDTIKVHLND
ncbi:hypothetical protein BB559_004842 [Furculomyces boomerangus]|uniref:Uncharacterized protein n=1 Tax=Furculomyces boomerangus TaxID=61424 RepID=A0A2T9YC79_9FUNG|nr:hypothetical protein BB559_004842 [Furculomyces boomerangus]